MYRHIKYSCKKNKDEDLKELVRLMNVQLEQQKHEISLQKNQIETQSKQIEKLMGKLEILPTPSGNIVSALFQNNIPVGVSSRGMGSLKQVGEIMEVQDDFELLCWDFVSTPSNPGSFMHTVNVGIKLNESLTRKTPQNKYAKANEIITELLCSHGTCPLF